MQIGSAVGSVVGQRVRVPAPQLRLLVACGAAAATAATFNAAIAGVFFAVELVMRDFSARTLGPVVIAAISATAVSRAVFGADPFLHVADFSIGSTPELVVYAGLGVLAAGVGVLFIAVLYGMEDVADRLWRWSEWARPIGGSVLLGLLLFAVPELYGSGYAVLEGAIDGRYVVLALVGLLVAKIVATSLTLSIGGSGGIFTPSLFMGAMLGSAYGASAQALAPGLAPAPEICALVGMGAMFAAAARAPFTAGAMVFELTGEPAVLLPLLAAIGVATALANLATRDTVYTKKLTRRGVDVDVPRSQSMMHVTVGEAMVRAHPQEPGAGAGTGASAAAGGSARAGAGAGVGAGGSAGARGSTGGLAAGAAVLHVDDSLDDAIHALAASDGVGLPVVDRDSGHVVGWLSDRDVLRVYHRRGGSAARDPRS